MPVPTSAAKRILDPEAVRKWCSPSRRLHLLSLFPFRPFLSEPLRRLGRDETDKITSLYNSVIYYAVDFNLPSGICQQLFSISLFPSVQCDLTKKGDLHQKKRSLPVAETFDYAITAAVSLNSCPKTRSNPPRRTSPLECVIIQFITASAIS